MVSTAIVAGACTQGRRDKAGRAGTRRRHAAGFHTCDDYRDQHHDAVVPAVAITLFMTAIILSVAARRIIVAITMTIVTIVPER